MKTAYLIRTETGEHGTFGVLSCPDIAFSCFSGELPDKGNRFQISCIPKGEYICKSYKSPKFGTVYHVQNVNNRTYILIHSGNYVGDTSKGWKTNSLGCILLGKSIGWLGKQKVVLSSRFALQEFHNKMKMESFKLIIK
ncbi:MAG: DUF5675 family protein [Cytophagaceae bacterium]|jgi:hypothetical protein|nr:DUF5675 family protein [Cytophagaceae bacterium]